MASAAGIPAGSVGLSEDPLAALRAKVESKKEDANGQDRFLTLLVTQLQNQDPLNPLDNAEVTSQLAQINTVKGLETLNQNITRLGESLLAAQLQGATGMIGRSVLVEGKNLTLPETGSARAGYQLDTDADQVAMRVLDATGQEVLVRDLGKASGGVHRFEWDGRDAAGKVRPPGDYRIEVSATLGGEPVTATPMQAARVQGLVRQDAGVDLELDSGASVPLSEARYVL